MSNKADEVTDETTLTEETTEDNDGSELELTQLTR
jgi:hypothetical protein